MKLSHIQQMKFGRSICPLIALLLSFGFLPASKVRTEETPPLSWAMRPLVPPELPAPILPGWEINPVDRFVNRKLIENNLEPSPSATKSQLLRRVFIDVWGLPPKLEDLESIKSTQFEKEWPLLVDRLLSSPHYGERWARHWMDLIHFAETHGHDEDALREHAWPYRDYLIRSFNEDKPYATFTIEQIAGDAIQPAQPDALVGTGFLAAGPWDESSQMGILDGTIDKLVAQYLDRDDMITTTMSSFLGLTVHCARCHDHKFDPISASDYYSLQAVFAGVDRNNRPYDQNAGTHQKRQRLLHLKTELLAGRYPDSELLNETSLQRVTSWTSSRQRVLDSWQAGQPEFEGDSASVGEFQRSDRSIFFPKPASPNGKQAWTFASPYSHPTAIQLEVFPDDRLPASGPGWATDGNFRLSEFKVFKRSDDGQSWTPVKLSNPQNDFSENTTSVRYLIDDDEQTTWGILPQTGQTHRCYFELPPETSIRKNDLIRMELIHQHGDHQWVGRCRVSVTDVSPKDTHPFLEASLQSAFETAAIERTSEQQLTLSRHATMEHWDRHLESLPPARQVYAATSFFQKAGNFKPALGPRNIHRLARGSIHSPKEIMAPGALTQFTHVPWNPNNRDLNKESQRRLVLGEWISHRENGLFWRTMANRVWQHHFGSPLAGTPNDLGNSGQSPTHPDLLDWLACELRDSGGSLKHLHRIILNSRTYRQSATYRTDAAQIDALNQLCWRMSPRRLDAEAFRDSLLALSDDLDPLMGGPSVKQFSMEPGIHVTPIIDYKGIEPDAPSLARRSIYRFLFRTLPDPFMQSMDCPDASNWTPKRAVSVGPLQALALMNDDLVIHRSQRMAQKLRHFGQELEEQITAWFRLSLLRTPTPEELDAVIGYAQKHGLANACRFLFNSNAFMFVE
jgi:hypothetical protein